MEILENIIAFITLIDQGTSIKASKKLNVTPELLIQKITELENIINLPLCKITEGTIKLTDYGETILPYCKKISESYDGIHTRLPRSTVKVPSL